MSRAVSTADREVKELRRMVDEAERRAHASLVSALETLQARAKAHRILAASSDIESLGLGMTAAHRLVAAFLQDECDKLRTVVDSYG